MNDLSRYTPNCPISPFSLRTGLNSGESELLLHHGKVRLLCSPWFGWAMVETWYVPWSHWMDHAVVMTVPWTVSPVRPAHLLDTVGSSSQCTGASAGLFTRIEQHILCCGVFF